MTPSADRGAGGARREDGRPQGGYPEGVLDVRRMGRIAYAEAHALQRELVARRIAGEWGDALVLCEHDPVVTLGRGTPRDAVEGLDLPVVEIERGGQATYHGPGQLVAYPVLALPPERRDLHRYLRDLEEVVLRVLAEVDVEGRRRPDLTGVWVGEKKIASVGVAVRQWVTWHGFALNVRTDLEAFRGFRPCGLEPTAMTRLADLVPDLPPGNVLLEVLVVKHVLDVFGLELPPIPRPSEPPESAGPAGPGFRPLPVLPS